MKYNRQNANKVASIMASDEIKVVHVDDLAGLLESLGVLNAVQNNSMKCTFCGDLITLDNIEAIIPLRGDIALSCSKPICRAKLLDERTLNDK
jgi:hypothetical protein